MAAEWVSRDEAMQRFRAIGLYREGMRFPSIIPSEKGIKKPDLSLIESSCSQLGAGNLLRFIEFSVRATASRQLGKKRFRKRSPSPSERAFILLRAFAPGLAAVVNAPALKGKGFVLRVDKSEEGSFSLSLSITHLNEGGPHAATFNFDMFFNRERKPGIVLGSMQRGRSDLAREFSEKMGQSPLEFLTQSFSRAFPGKQLVGLSARHHPYRNPSPEILAVKLRDERKISADECLEYRVFMSSAMKGAAPYPQEMERGHGLALNSKDRAVRKVAGLVEAERVKIRTSLTGAHKSAFKKAGLNVKSRSRYWRRRK